jgi:cysteine desulfurase
MGKTVYMDHSATTPPRQEVAEHVRQQSLYNFGNASSVHTPGQKAKASLEESREKIARNLGASPDEIIFTSGGSESNNLAIKGVAQALGATGRHIITSAVEHPSALKPCEWLEESGFDVTYLPVDETGRVSCESLADAVRSDTILVSIMTANNEVGTLQPIAELAKVARDADVLFHTDAVQAAGKVSLDVEEFGVDLLTISGHKFYGPKGVGVLYRRKGTRLKAVQLGGHHEGNLRAGTENVPGIAGMALALELACDELPEERNRLSELRDRLQAGILERIGDVIVNGHPESRVPHILNVSVKGVEGESLLLGLDALGVAASSGSACTSGTLDPSHVLTAMGIPPEIAHGSVRFSLGRENTVEDVDYVLDVFPQVVKRFRDMSPVYKPGM